MRRPLVCLFALFVSACAGPASTAPGYQDGYGEGCATANDIAAGTLVPRKRDEARYMIDADYRAGWNSGFGNCRGVELPGQVH